jgi:D-arginine dehydrogenase
MTAVIILGAGIAGASLAAQLAPLMEVALVELEDQPGRHATGRSAAMFFESYGNATIRALTRASRQFLDHPPEGFCESPLMTPRSALLVAAASQAQRLDALCGGPAAAHGYRRIDAAETLARMPILRPEWATSGGVLDDSGHDIDVAGLHQGYLRAAKRAGCRMVYGLGEIALERRSGLWQVRGKGEMLQAPLLVNACGAWADLVAAQAGARTVGLQPMRRTALTIPAPAHHDIRDWPLVIDIDESCYFKPDAGQLLLSPANEDPMPPCDVAPEELDVAIAVDRFEQMTTESVRKVSHRWAGLRSFVADRSPVVGFDSQADGFFWLAGQGGYGIQTAPAMARVAACLLTGAPLPTDIAGQGIAPEHLLPTRPALSAPSSPRQA